jgi:hypothetical protein
MIFEVETSVMHFWIGENVEEFCIKGILKKAIRRYDFFLERGRFILGIKVENYRLISKM